MMNSFFAHWINMDGYGFYIWTSYGLVGMMLLINWVIPTWRWKKYLQATKNNKKDP